MEFQGRQSLVGSLTVLNPHVLQLADGHLHAHAVMKPGQVPNVHADMQGLSTEAAGRSQPPQRDWPAQKQFAGDVTWRLHLPASSSLIIRKTMFHILRPRFSSMYRSGYRYTSNSVRSVMPPSTIALASAIARRAVTTAPTMSPPRASISRASCTGAITLTPRSTARQQANRSISAPFACMGKLRRLLGFGSPSTKRFQPKVVNK